MELRYDPGNALFSAFVEQSARLLLQIDCFRRFSRHLFLMLTGLCRVWFTASRFFFRQGRPWRGSTHVSFGLVITALGSWSATIALVGTPSPG